MKIDKQGIKLDDSAHRNEANESTLNSEHDPLTPPISAQSPQPGRIPMTEVFLTVVLPAYNEERRLPLSIEKLFKFLEIQPYSSEVIVVDDGSEDSTATTVEDLIKVRET